MKTHSTRSVLIVDDDEVIRETLHWLFEDAGYGVIEASDGAEALAILRASAHPLVVLLDLMMPHVNGQQVMEAVASDRHLATFHSYVLLTANAHLLSPAFRDMLATLSVVIVAKPFDLDELYETVEQAAGHLAQA